MFCTSRKNCAAICTLIFHPFIELGTSWVTGIQFSAAVRTFVSAAMRIPVAVSVQHCIKSVPVAVSPGDKAETT